MAKFYTQFNRPARVIANPGNPIKTLYGPKFDKNGVMHLVETGKHNLYDEIQSHADSVDIHVLLQRFAQGDVGVFSRVQGAYGDFTQMPSTFAEALNVMIAAEQYFNGLPVDVRAKFGHDFHQFVASMDSPTWIDDMGIDVTPATPEPSPTPPSAPASAPSSPMPASPASAPSGES